MSMTLSKTDTHLMVSFFPGQRGEAGTRKVKTILDFNGARNDGVAVTSAESYGMQIILYLAPDR